MLSKALASGRDWEFAINFSGNCYPIKTLYQIETRLNGLKGRNFMDIDGKHQSQLIRAVVMVISTFPLGLSGFQDSDKTRERWGRFWVEVERVPTLPTLRTNTLSVEEICPSCYKEQANSWGWVRVVSSAADVLKGQLLTVDRYPSKSSAAFLIPSWRSKVCVKAPSGWHWLAPSLSTWRAVCC